MEKIKCEECGAVLEDTMKECPKCGCPVTITEKAITPISTDTKIKTNVKSTKSIMPFIGILLGIVIVCLGMFVTKTEVSIESYTANNYKVDSAMFGADFYTEIYKASDTIVDELNDINGGVAVLSESVVEIINAIYFSAGMIICAIGIAVISISCVHIKRN